MTSLRITLFIFGFLSVFSASNAYAKDFGLGVLLFNPTAISVQGYLSSQRSIDGALAWDLHKNNEIYLHSTYLFHKPNHIHINSYFFDVFYGIGAYLYSKKPESDFGCRLALGSAYNAKTIPIELFAEFVANINLVPNTSVLLNIGLGGRFYF